MTSSQLPKAKKISPCPYFEDCGGCDFLDLTQKDYQELKQKNYPDAEWIWVGPHSRRKIILQIGRKNEVGFFAEKSKSLVEIESCFVAEKEVSDAILLLKNFFKTQEQNIFTQVAITLFDNGLDLVFSVSKEPNFTQLQKIISFAKEKNFNASYKIKNQLTPIFLSRRNQIFFDDFKIDLGSEIFIQATKQGLESITKIIRNFIASFEKGGGAAGDGGFLKTNSDLPLKKPTLPLRVADIYAGFGAYSFAIQDVVKSISAFEGDQKMVDSISKNAAANDLSHKIKAEVRDLVAIPISKRELQHFDLAIINPPRNGASPQVLEIAKSTLKNVIYVSCNPQSFERDSKILIDSGFKLKKLFALDQFYSTKHLELVAIFTR